MIYYLIVKAKNKLRAKHVSTVYTIPEYSETSQNNTVYYVNINEIAPELVQ
jgi:hypothetical protein